MKVRSTRWSPGVAFRRFMVVHSHGNLVFLMRSPLCAGMRVDSGRRRVRGGLRRVAEAPRAAKRPRQRQFLCRFLRHAGDPVLGLW